MKKLFIDGSVNPQLKIGYGACLYVEKDLDLSKILFNRFENTSSTKLELQTLLWALEKYKNKQKLEIYTDCQNIINLLQRREKLEKNQFFTSKNELLKNHDLYKEFYKYCDFLDLVFIKVKGHKKNSLKDENDEIFSFVDKKVRKKLKEEFK